MLFNGLDYRIGNRECLFLDHLQGFFGIGSEQIIQDQILQLQSVFGLGSKMILLYE